LLVAPEIPKLHVAPITSKLEGDAARTSFETNNIWGRWQSFESGVLFAHDINNYPE
jgi:hypothetical protein